MPRPRQAEPSAIALRLQSGGPQSAQLLATALRVDRSSISRALALPALAPQLVRLGSTRSVTYALRRSVRGAGDTFSIRRIDADGRARDWAQLIALHGGWRLDWADAQNAPAWSEQILGLGGFAAGFPFFLGEARPQGHLGRSVGRALSAALNLPPDPRNWSDDDTLVYLQAEGDDLPGDLIVGDVPLRRVQGGFLNPSPPLPGAERAELYPALAAASVSSGNPGSSVEGEQPKFLVTLAAGDEVMPVLVKFTDVIATPTGRRWADLLAAEAHAITLLHAHGEAHAVPRLLDAAERRFLETPRYDRVGPRGRRGVVSLRALHDAFGGPDASTWPVAAANLHALGLIEATALRSIRLRHAFGTLIGNTDMHFGNLAFFLGDTLPLRLAPAYDMLPMLWAPTPGQATPTPTFAPTPPLPDETPIWNEAAAWAVEFWSRVAGDARGSAEFAAQARAAGAQVARMREIFG
ncbi:MAG: type II toxin-antitoxin system HipA family toxin YjjJ [Undibacterium sp.]|nr:type II toxin-antitoxin system HipA family toxin YjjJ [Opitutaceae bacterium]